MEMRRISYWALTQPIDNDFLDRYYERNCNIPNYTGGYSARLQHNMNAYRDGVTVYLHSDNGGLFFESLQFASVARNGQIDASYPVDINLYDGYGKPSLGTVFYKDYDFKGTFIEVSTAVASAIKGTGFIYGYLKGFGYTEYLYTNVDGLAWSLPSFSGGTMTGKYVGKGIASPNSFIDYGETEFSGAGIFQLGKWISKDVKEEKDTKEGNVLWRGDITGIGITVPVGKIISELKGIVKIITGTAGEITGGEIRTQTEIIFPAMNLDTENIFKEYYDK
jgi:hypothetical protein